MFEPPDWPRAFSETPRLNTCGSSCSSWVVVTALEVAISSRPTAIRAEPTGGVPRMRLPVTTTSSTLASAAAPAAVWAATGAAAPSVAVMAMTDAQVSQALR